MRNTMANGELLHITRQNRATVPSFDIFGSYVKDNDRPAWWIRAGIFVGTLMPNDSPKGWGWNPSVITLAILCASLIAGASWFISDLNATVKQIKEDSKAAKEKADRAESIALTGELPTPTPKQEKK